MLKKKLALMPRVVILALAAAAVSAAPSAATPASPGACHMLEANLQGIAGMDGSQGGKNMVPLVVASLGVGCTP